MALRIDNFNKLILIDSPQVAVTCQEIHDFIEDFQATPVGMAFPDDDDPIDPNIRDIQLPEGKIDLSGGLGTKFSGIILKIHSLYQIQFWAGSGYTEITGGTIVGGVGGRPIKATGAAGDITVLERPVDGIIQATGGTSAPSAEEVATAVWADQVAQLLFKYHDNKTVFFAADGTTEVTQGNAVRVTAYDDDGVTPIKTIEFRNAADQPVALPLATKYVRIYP